MLEVSGDPTMLQQAVTNLLSNAVKYTNKTRNPVVKLFSEDAATGQVAFTVSDNGIGFSQDAATRLFQPFQRLHTGTDFPGHGFGLATVKRIVERHGGSMSAQAQEGVGASFVVRLPAAEPPPP